MLEHHTVADDELQECLKYYDDMIAQARKKGRKEWIEDKKKLLEEMKFFMEWPDYSANVFNNRLHLGTNQVKMMKLSEYESV